MVDRERIVALGLTNVTPEWKNEGSRGQRPGITTAEVLGGTKAKTNSLFNKPKSCPTQEEQKLMIALAIESGITAVMKSHIYRFNDDIYLQKDGVPIGLELNSQSFHVMVG